MKRVNSGEWIVANGAGDGFLEPKLLAAVMAAVQAYMDDEERGVTEERPARLSLWKMAAWQPWRGRAHPLDMGWRRAG